MMASQPFFIPALIFMILALPLILELVPRQWILGIRTPKTLTDEATWYRANRFGGWAFLISSLVYLGVAWAVPCLAPCGTNFAQWLVHLAAFGLPLVLSIFAIRLYVQSL
jgi:hypothetical protein